MKKVIIIIIFLVFFAFFGYLHKANYKYNNEYSKTNGISLENNTINSANADNELVERDSYSEVDTGFKESVTVYDDINEAIKKDVCTLKQLVINNEELFNIVGEIIAKHQNCNVFLNEDSEWDFGTLDLTSEEKQTIIDALNILQKNGFTCVLENYRNQLNVCFVTHINYSDNWIEMGIIYKDKNTNELLLENFSDLVIDDLYLYCLSSV